MKVVAFNGSARKDGNTAQLINWAFEELNKAGIETELIQLAGKTIRGCTACYKCSENKNGRCVLDQDPVNEYIQKMVEADGMIIGTPTYFADASPEIMALLNRAGMVTRANGGQLTRKVGAAVVAVRRAGAIHAFDSINHFFLICQMIIPGSSYWNIGVGRGKGEVAADVEAQETMYTLGKNMAWLLQKIHQN